MNCECNNNSNRVKPRIKHVYGNVLRMAIPLTLRTLVKDGDEMIVNDTDFIPSSDHLVRVVFSKGKTNYPITATMDGNVAIIEDKGKIPVGTYDISVECYDDLGNPYRFKQNAVLYVADTTAEAGIDEEIEYEAQTWYLNAAVFLATTEIGEIGDVIDAKLDDVFGNVLYDANAKEIRFYNKGNSRVLATIDSRPFVVDGTVADVYIDVSRQVLDVVLNEDAGGRRFSVPLYLVFNSYYKKDEVDSLVSRTVENVRLDFSQELPFVVPVTKNGSSISSSIDYGTIDNAIREDGRLVVACVNNGKFYQLLNANGMEVVFSRVVALDGYQELLIVDESNVWSMEDVALGTGGGGGGYEPPVGGIPKSDLASDVQASLDLANSALQSQTQADWNESDTSDPSYIANKPTLATVATSGSYNDLSNKPTIPAGVTVDSTITQGGTNAVQGGAIYTALQGKADTADLPTKVSDLTNDSGFTSNSPATAAPSMDGTAAVGSSAKYAREDHVHPHDSTKLSKSDVSVETQGDGTVDINVGSGANKDTYTINLNHTHEGMAKLVKCTEATLPQTMADDTIYVQVDNLTTPTEIEALHIFGLEFTGGGGGSTPSLPYGAEIEYLQSSGTQYIDTGIFPSTNFECEIKAEYINNQLRYDTLLGSFTNTDAYGVALAIRANESSGYIQFGRDGTGSIVISAISTLGLHTYKTSVKSGAISISVDGTSTSDIYSAGNPSSLSMYMFARHRQDTGVGNYSNAKIYYCKIWNGGNLVFDAIPVRVGTTGYMYDKVSGQLLGNSGSGSFTLGNDKS